MTRSMTLLIVAGASGSLGRAVVADAVRRGVRVRALGRNQKSLESLGAHEIAVCDPVSGRDVAAAVQGADAIVSSLGASVMPELGKGYRGYVSVDTPANVNLLGAAQSAGVRRFVYVSVAGHDVLGHLAYVRAHELVVDAIVASGLEHAIVRPTGFFSAFTAFVRMAKSGRVPVFGNPDVRTNPIADEDLAATCVDQALAPGPVRAQMTIGGPDVLTRRRIAEMAFEVQGRKPALVHVPSWCATTLAAIGRPMNPRISDFTRFLVALSNRDCLGRPVGHRRLEDCFRASAARVGAGRAGTSVHEIPPRSAE